jgi:hypothetical protein
MKTPTKALLGLLRTTDLLAGNKAADFQAAGFALGISAAQSVGRQDKKSKKPAASKAA